MRLLCLTDFKNILLLEPSFKIRGQDEVYENSRFSAFASFFGGSLIGPACRRANLSE
jgi:hypothetical protein